MVTECSLISTTLKSDVIGLIRNFDTKLYKLHPQCENLANNWSEYSNLRYCFCFLANQPDNRYCFVSLSGKALQKTLKHCNLQRFNVLLSGFSWFDQRLSLRKPHFLAS